MQWRQRLGNFGGINLRKGEGILGDGSHPVGFRGKDPIGGVVDEPPKLKLIMEMGVKLTFYEGKIENAYMSRCFLKRTHAAVLSIHDNGHT